MTNLTFTNAENITIIADLDAKTIKIGEDKKIKCASKSDIFRHLYDAQIEISEIAKTCESHYSFVYGVISASREVRKTTKASKSDDIRKLCDEGKTPGDIAKELNSNYSFVYSVCKKHKATKVNEIPEESEEIKEA